MSVKLTYFNARGLAEPIRYILAYGTEEFEDVRFPVVLPPKVPPEIKPSCTWGQLPIVEFGDGKKLAQSLAITRFFAKKHGLVPKDDFQAALCDEYVDACRDFLVLWVPVFYEKEDTLEEKFNEVSKTAKARFLSVFESIIEANGGKHLVGNDLTWADIYLAHVVSNIKMAIGKCALGDEFPGIKNLIDVVFNAPGIKEWIEKRPESKF